MKILFLCHSLNIGGTETYILRFAKWLGHKHPNHKLHVVCKSGVFGPYETDYRSAGVSLQAMHLGYFSPFQYLKYIAFLRRHQFDAVCDFGGDFGALPIGHAYAVGVPRRLTFYRNARNDYIPTLLKRTYQSLLHWVVRHFSTMILSNSWDALSYFYPKYPIDCDPRFKVIPNGIPLPTVLSAEERKKLRIEANISENQKMVLHVGGGRYQKNHQLILKVARMCQEEDKQVKFLLVGPDVQEKYDVQVKEWGLKNICFLGMRRDVYKLLQIADIFIFPSLHEGQPNALLEAIVSGLPFIASNIEPIKEMLPEEWKKRWLILPNDYDGAYRLLRTHLDNDFRNELRFCELVQWCSGHYDEDICFDRLFQALTT